jgi:hypothetical protein
MLPPCDLPTLSSLRVLWRTEQTRLRPLEMHLLYSAAATGPAPLSRGMCGSLRSLQSPAREDHVAEKDALVRFMHRATVLRCGGAEDPAFRPIGSENIRERGGPKVSAAVVRNGGAGVWHTEAIKCTLSVGREVKTEIPVRFRFRQVTSPPMWCPMTGTESWRNR